MIGYRGGCSKKHKGAFWHRVQRGAGVYIGCMYGGSVCIVCIGRRQLVHVGICIYITGDSLTYVFETHYDPRVPHVLLVTSRKEAWFLLMIQFWTTVYLVLRIAEIASEYRYDLLTVACLNRSEL